MAVAGSAEMFRDAWLAHEGNAALLAWLLAWLQPVSRDSMRSPATKAQLLVSGLLQHWAWQSIWLRL